MGKKVPDVPVGTQINSWTVLEHLKLTKETMYRCKCVCGTEKTISKSNLRLGKSKSCNTGECHITGSFTHGLTNHKLYSVWCGIKSRLRNPTGNNACYAGIKMSRQWKDFQNFYDWAIKAGYAEGLTIDREDRTGNYTPENCRWVSDLVQSQNRSKHAKKEIPYKGVYKSKPRNGKVLYANTGHNPYYWIVIYNGERHQKHGFVSAEAAYQDRLTFVAENYPGLVITD